MKLFIMKPMPTFVLVQSKVEMIIAMTHPFFFGLLQPRSSKEGGGGGRRLSRGFCPPKKSAINPQEGACSVQNFRIQAKAQHIDFVVDRYNNMLVLIIV
jgi:hypothetical protein